MAILIGTVSAEDLNGAHATVRTHGLAVFGVRDLEALERLYFHRAHTGEAFFFYFCTPAAAAPGVVVAAGRVAGVWKDVPETKDLAGVSAEFEAVFGRRWEDVVVGAEREKLFGLWRGYIGVTGLQPHPETTVNSIKESAGRARIYELLLG
ncbi:MAG: hypothetical protein AB1507_01995 [Bacillota bacterium]|nr:hypothetical protein [Thermoanaerobacteraceae bacterium]